jgi:hypothetical protein
MNAKLYDPLLKPFAGYVIDRCNATQREAFFERAAVLEFEAGARPRALAEALAVLDLLRRTPQLLTGVVALEIERDGATQWMLALDQIWTGGYVESCGGRIVAVHDPANLLLAQYGGVALLGTFG